MRNEAVGRQGRWHRHALRVRYQETDRMGVVFHTNYINWFEIGRTELIRDRGFPYRRIEQLGFYLPVVELESRFHQPAKYDDNVAVYTRIADFTARTIRFESEVRRCPERTESQPSLIEPEGELLVAGQTRHVWLNRDWKPVRIDKEAPELHRLLGES